MADTANSKVQFTVDFNSPDTNKHFASDDLATVATSGLMTADFLYTFAFRYPRLGTDIANVQGNPIASDGTSLDYAHDHSWISAVVTLIIVCSSLGTTVITYRGIKHAKGRSSYNVIYKNLPTEIDDKKTQDTRRNISYSPVIKGSKPLIDKNTSDKDRDKFITPIDINAKLNEALAKNAALKKRYSSIKVSPAKDEKTGNTTGWNVEMEKVQPLAPSTWSSSWLYQKGASAWDTLWKYWDTFSNSLGIMSYVYWIFVIAASVVTGIFFGGFSSTAIGFSLGVPLAAGCGYVGLKIKNKITNRHLKREEQNDFNTLTEETLLEQEEKDALNTQEVNKPKATRKITIPGMTAAAVASTAVTATVGSYIGWQYNLWYITDFLTTVFKVACMTAAEALGIGILVGAVIAGAKAAYDAYQKYKANKNNPAPKPAPVIVRSQLSDYFKLDSTLLLEKQQKAVHDLEAQLARTEKHTGPVSTPLLDARIQQAREADEKTKTHSWLQSARNVLHVANFGMSGVFVARTIIISTTTSFLLPGIAAAAICLSTPWTIGIFVLAGLAWGLYRYYEYRKGKNQQKLAEANRRIDLLEKKIHILSEAGKSSKLDNELAITNSSTKKMASLSPETSETGVELYSIKQANISSPTAVVAKEPVAAAANTPAPIASPADAKTPASPSAVASPRKEFAITGDNLFSPANLSRIKSSQGLAMVEVAGDQDEKIKNASSNSLFNDETDILPKDKKIPRVKSTESFDGLFGERADTPISPAVGKAM